MVSQRNWIAVRVRRGWILLVVGILVVLAGIGIGWANADSPYNFRIISGVGILLIGIGIGYLVRYRTALSSERSARQRNVEERDERTVSIRTRAGNRAFWVSTAFVVTGLMWSSNAANGGVPALVGDTLWYFLAAATLIPFAVYVGSILADERTS